MVECTRLTVAILLFKMQGYQAFGLHSFKWPIKTKRNIKTQIKLSNVSYSLAHPTLKYPSPHFEKPLQPLYGIAIQIGNCAVKR